MTNPPNNPFGQNRFGAGTTPAPVSVQRPSTTPAQPQQNGSLLNRTTRSILNWTVVPLSNMAVRFDLKGLGDPFHRLLNTPLDIQYSRVESIGKRLVEDGALQTELTQLLDRSWAAYSLMGAIMLYPFNDGVKKAYTQAPLPIVPAIKSESDKDDEASEVPHNATMATHVCLRAIDLELVINVLVRTRAFILASDTPLALEPSFFEQSFICDDPRLVDIALATGTIEESWA